MVVLSRCERILVICLAVLAQYQLVTDRQTDGRTDWQRDGIKIAFIYLNLETKYNAKAIGTYRHHSTYKSDM